MPAVVVRFHLGLHVAVVEVETIEIRVQRAERCLVLQQIRAGLEQLGLGCRRLTRSSDIRAQCCLHRSRRGPRSRPGSMPKTILSSSLHAQLEAHLFRRASACPMPTCLQSSADVSAARNLPLMTGCSRMNDLLSAHRVVGCSIGWVIALASCSLSGRHRSEPEGLTQVNSSRIPRLPPPAHHRLPSLGPANISVPPAASPPEDGQWTMPSRDYANTRYSGLEDINADNVGQLQLALRSPPVRCCWTRICSHRGRRHAVLRDSTAASNDTAHLFAPGLRVRHPSFGEGEVIRAEDQQIRRQSARRGEKRILASKLRAV